MSVQTGEMANCVIGGNWIPITNQITISVAVRDMSNRDTDGNLIGTSHSRTISIKISILIENHTAIIS